MRTIGRDIGPMGPGQAQFDSHRFVKRCTEAGLSEEVAEILAEEHANLMYRRDVATKTDVANMATKEDVARCVTREDIANMATKDDFAKCATREDIANMATKDDVANLLTRDDLLEFKVSMIKWAIATMAVFAGTVIGAFVGAVAVLT